MISKYSIGLFILSIVLAGFISFNIYGEFRAKEISTKAEESITTDGQAFNEECFYLYEINGYVVVFLYDKKTPYEYTDIVYEELPELMRKEIQNGKYIKNIEELYGFLENYSS